MQREQRPTIRLAGGMLWGVFGIALVIITGVGVLALWSSGTHGPRDQAELRPVGVVPDFVLVERRGQPLARTDLLGKVWVVDFIFTQCVAECPLLSAYMAQLQGAFAAEDDLRLVSISVDPEHDTPEILSQYAERFGAHTQRWLFLTGEKELIYRLAREGFHLGVADPNEARHSSALPVLPDARKAARSMLDMLALPAAWAHHPDTTRQPMLHSARFVLIDRQGQIRGYYDSREEEARRRLRRHVGVLLREPTS